MYLAIILIDHLKASLPSLGIGFDEAHHHLWLVLHFAWGATQVTYLHSSVNIIHTDTLECLDSQRRSQSPCLRQYLLFLD